MSRDWRGRQERRLVVDTHQPQVLGLFCQQSNITPCNHVLFCRSFTLVVPCRVALKVIIWFHTLLALVHLLSHDSTMCCHLDRSESLLFQKQSLHIQWKAYFCCRRAQQLNPSELSGPQPSGWRARVQSVWISVSKVPITILSKSQLILCCKS